MESVQLKGYSVGKILGEGCNAVVREGYSTTFQKKVALKFLKKTSVPESFKLECEILSKLSHPNIIQLYEVIEEADFLCAAMEYCSSGDLLIYIQQMEKLEELESKRIFIQILSAVRYLHDQRIIHRDLKAENILLDSHMNPKLGDFGFAGYFNPEGVLNKSCGSLHYAAPELCEGKAYKGPEVDIWSLGVLLYGMITGTLPFDGYDAREIITKVCDGRFYIPESVSNQCMDLLKTILVVNPLKRATLEEIETDPWITGKPRDPIDELFNSNIRLFAGVMEDHNSLSASQKFRKLLLAGSESPKAEEKAARNRGSTTSVHPPPETEVVEDKPVVLRKRGMTKHSLMSPKPEANDAEGEKQSIRTLVTKMFRSKKIASLHRRASFSDSPLEGGTPDELYKGGHFGEILKMDDLMPQKPKDAKENLPKKTPEDPPKKGSDTVRTTSETNAEAPAHTASDLSSSSNSSTSNHPHPHTTTTTTTSSSTSPEPQETNHIDKNHNSVLSGQKQSTLTQSMRENKTAIRLLKTGKKTGSMIFRRPNKP